MYVARVHLSVIVKLLQGDNIMLFEISFLQSVFVGVGEEEGLRGVRGAGVNRSFVFVPAYVSERGLFWSR